jgi:hypothetical protein
LSQEYDRTYEKGRHYAFSFVAAENMKAKTRPSKDMEKERQSRRFLYARMECINWGLKEEKTLRPDLICKDI